MSTFAPSINNDLRPLGRFFEVTCPSSVMFGAKGEARKFMSWGGVVLLIEGETTTRTFALGDVTELTNTERSGQAHALDGSATVQSDNQG